MKKSDLHTGMIVTLRNGESYYVMLNTGFTWSDQQDVLVHKVLHETGWMPLARYTDDLDYHDDPDSFFPSSSEEDDKLWDIVQVDACREAVYLFQANNYHTIWTREE